MYKRSQKDKEFDKSSKCVNKFKSTKVNGSNTA